MTSPTSSLTDKVSPLRIEGSVAAVAFLGAHACLVSSEGQATLAGLAGGDEVKVPLHAGIVLSAESDGARLVSGGDDGRVMALAQDGTAACLAEVKGRWIDRVALGPSGAVAYSAGRVAHVLTAPGAEPKTFEAPSTVGGLAFAPKGLRLAVAHYGGATLWFPNAPAAKPELLAWKGSHLGVAFSPDGRFLVTTMQEPALHGWRIVDGAHMRMSGYPSRVKSFGFTADGKWLATSGSGEAVLWPFQAKDGPMGKEPMMLAPSPTSRVTVVSCHPKDPVVAVGYEDGMVLMARISDGAEILLRAPDSDAVSGIAWHPAGGAIAFGTQGGSAGILAF